MQQCTRCDGVVSEQFARVFGDDDDVVHGCSECMTNVELSDGLAAIPPESDDEPEIDDSVSMLYRDREQ